MKKLKFRDKDELLQLVDQVAGNNTIIKLKNSHYEKVCNGRRDYEIFASHNVSRSIQWIPVENTFGPPIQCVEQWREGRDSAAKNPKNPRLKSLENPRKQSQARSRVAGRLSKFDTPRLAEVRWKTTRWRKVLEGRRPHCRSSTAAIAVRRSRAHSCGSHLWRHP